MAIISSNTLKGNAYNGVSMSGDRKLHNMGTPRVVKKKKKKKPKY